ncbi:28S ribosomal protein S5, mitochondrial, partial [Coemansia sp. RSA 2673]
MSTIAVRLARRIPSAATGVRAFSASAFVAKSHSTLGNVISAQKAKELGANISSASNIDALVKEEHNVFEPPDDFLIKYPKPKHDKSLVRASEDDGMFWSEDLLIPYEQFVKLSKKTLVMKRTVQMTRKGKIPSMYAMVVVGNGMGSAGFGEGKSAEASKAVMMAT